MRLGIATSVAGCGSRLASSLPVDDGRDSGLVGRSTTIRLQCIGVNVAL
jgi:hypothetical protein